MTNSLDEERKRQRDKRRLPVIKGPESEKKGPDLVWTMQSGIHETIKNTEADILATLEIDANRTKTLTEVSKLFAEMKEYLKATFGKINFTDLEDIFQNKEKRKSLLDKLIISVKDNQVLEKIQSDINEFKKIPFVRELLTPSIYARLEYVLNEMEKRVQKIIAILSEKKFTVIEYENLKNALAVYSNFQKYAFENVLTTINSFVNHYKVFGGAVEELEEHLNDALKLPGYPLDSIRAIHTMLTQGDNIKSSYNYYRDSRYSPQELKDSQEILIAERDEKVSQFKAERADHIKVIIGCIKDQKAFVGIVKKLLLEKKLIKENTKIDFTDSEIIQKMQEAKIFENHEVFGFLADNKVLDNKVVIESLENLGKIQVKIERLEQQSVDNMFETKLRNENFLILTSNNPAIKMSFDEMAELYDLWAAVKKKLPSTASAPSKTAS